MTVAGTALNIGTIVPTSAGTAQCVVYATAAGAVGVAIPTVSGTALTWNGTALAWIAIPTSLPSVVNAAATGTVTLSGFGTLNINTFAGSQTLALPATAALYSIAYLQNISGTGPVIVSRSTAQTITTTGTLVSTGASAGSATLNQSNSSAEVLCTTANTGFAIINYCGTTVTIV